MVDDLHRVDDSPAVPVRARRVRREQAGRAPPGAARPTSPGPADRSAARDREARRRHLRRLEVLRGGSAGDAGRPVSGHRARETSRQSPSGLAGGPLLSSSPRSPCGPNEPGSSTVHEDRNTFPAGSERLVDSYLWHEVLRTERAELVELLLSTAVVDRMNYGLADALTGRSDAGDLLLEAEARGLFVTSFDPGGWYEVHGLVREMLLAELDRRSPEQLRTQHARAAQWFESMDDGVAALGHWLDAGQPAEALRLLTATSMSLFDEWPGRRDRPDHRADPSAGGGCRCRLVGAVRLVPPARRPHRVPRRSGSSGGGGHPAGCSRRGRSPGHPARGVGLALRGLAGLRRPRPGRPRGARGPRTGRPHRAVRLEPRGPWGGPGRALVRPGRDRREGTGGCHP